MEPAEEQDLIQRCLQGEAECFAELVKRYETMIRTMVARMVKDESVVEELAQEVFIQAFEKLHQFRGNSKFSTWLGQIALNKSRDHLRKKKRLHDRPIDEFQVPSTEAGPYRVVCAREECGLLALALAALKARERHLIVLRHVQDFDYATIALMLNSTPEAVKVGSFRARAKLRTELTRLGVQS